MEIEAIDGAVSHGEADLQPAELERDGTDVLRPW
jgi:hypothetical protein